MRLQARRLGLWLLVAVVLLAPASLTPWARLLGAPDVDVWNHAWGFWFVSQALFDGSLPFRTPLVGGPAGGTLYFIDTPAAVLWAPVTAALGPAVAYNAALVLRVALAGWSGQLLAEALGAGKRAWLAGLALCTLPFLLCELANGISEVCGLHFAVLSLWALVRLRETGSWKHALALGACLGLTGVGSFYYGLAMGLVVALGLGATVLGRARQPGTAGLLGRGAAAAALSVVLAAPVWMVFKASLAAPDALIQRAEGMNAALLAHNAVDPRIYLMPGHFQSVDLAGLYGEPFVHTAYLRWSLLLLAGLALWRRRHLWGWAALALVSAVLGLGSLLWWGGDWVTLGGRALSLPFGWLMAVLPEVAITHPLRLSLAAQILVCALAAVGLSEVRGPRVLPVIIGIIVVGEGLFASAARWPLPTADAAIPAAYDDLAEGMVLDLPAEVGTTMKTSRYFWYQTAHGRPIPYTPDVRLGSARDADAFQALTRPSRGGAGEVPQAPNGRGLAHLQATYAAVVVHPELEVEAALSPTYSAVLAQGLGAGTPVDGVLRFTP